MTTTITAILLVYGIAATIALACALEAIGFWKLQAENAEAEIADDNVIIAGLNKLIGGHIRDSAVLLTLGAYDEHVELVPGEVAAAVDAWLSGEGVAE